MTDRELADAAWSELTQTTISYPKWKQQGFTAGHWANAKRYLDQIAAPPPPPVSGQIVYAHDYNQPAPAYGWDWGFQNIPTAIPVAVLTDGYRPGVPSMRITVPVGSGSQHAEGLKKWPVKIGEDLYFGFACKFHSPWGEPSPDGWGAAIAQLNYQACVNHTWGLFAHADHVRLVLLSGKQTINPVTRQYDNTATAPHAIDGLDPDAWYRIVARIRSAYDTSGLTQVWVKGGSYTDWTQTVELPSVPTLQCGTCYAGNTIGCTSEGYTLTHKWGYYTGSRTVERVYEHANILIGTSLAAVQAVL